MNIQNLSKWLLVLVCFGLVSASPVSAQLMTGDPEAPQHLDDETLLKENSMHVEFMTSVLMKALEGAKLSEEQLAKVEVVIEKEVPNVVLKSMREKESMTPEQHRLYREELSKLRRMGLANGMAQSVTLKNLKVDDLAKRRFTIAKKAADKARQQLNEKIAACLTEEQRATLPMFGGADKKFLRRIRVDLPNMNSDEDFALVKKSFESIKGVSDFKMNRSKKQAVFNSFYSKRMSKAMLELKEKPVFEDYSSFILLGRIDSDNWQPVDLEDPDPKSYRKGKDRKETPQTNAVQTLEQKK